MALLKCKMCGGQLDLVGDETVVTCDYCGSKQTVPTADNEKKMNLFVRANRLRSACEFDKAAGVYESIVSEFQEEAEAYWGLVLCKYGIEYVDDPATGKKIPTCHRSSFDSVMEDSNFEMTLEYADSVARSVYREEAKAFERIRTGIIEVSSKEEPYDIFICYKETDENGNRTLDSVLAQDVYDALTNKGYKVFFSRITLEDKLGVEYEPYIFAALNSSKIMLVFGTDYEYFNAVWVKNEWSRFLSLIAKGEKKTLIPCYKDIDAYDMPNEFKRLQAQDLGKLGAVQDLVRGIEKILGSKQQESSSSKASGGLTKRGYLYLEDKDYSKAIEYFEKALDDNPEDGNAYIGEVLAKLKIQSLDELDRTYAILEDIPEFMKAIRFSDENQKKRLTILLEMNRKKASENKELIQDITNGNMKKLIELGPLFVENVNSVPAHLYQKSYGCSENRIKHLLFTYEVYQTLKSASQPMNTKDLKEANVIIENADENVLRAALVELNNEGIIVFENYKFFVVDEEYINKKQYEKSKVFLDKVKSYQDEIGTLENEIQQLEADEQSSEIKAEEIEIQFEKKMNEILQKENELNKEDAKLREQIQEKNNTYEFKKKEHDLIKAKIINLNSEIKNCSFFQSKRKKELEAEVEQLQQKQSECISVMNGVNKEIKELKDKKSHLFDRIRREKEDVEYQYSREKADSNYFRIKLKTRKDKIELLKRRIDAESKSAEKAKTAWTPVPIDLEFDDRTTMDEDYEYVMKTFKNNKVAAIKFWREKTGLGLVDAKQVIDSMFDGTYVPKRKKTVSKPVSSAQTVGKTQSLYGVVLNRTGRDRVAVIKVIRELTGLGLVDAKKMADHVPSTVLVNVPYDLAMKAKTTFELAGAEVELFN